MHVAACEDVAAAQYGAIARQQALASGVSRDAIRFLMREGLWQRVLPSTYSLWVPSSERDRRLQRLMAGTLWLGEESAISCRAAAMLWRLDGVGSCPFEFSTTRRKRYRPPGFVIHVVSSLPATDLRSVEGLRVTSVPRTLLDIASLVRAEQLERALESALRLQLATVTELSEALDKAGPTIPGRPLLRELIEALPGTGTDSELETRAWQLFRTSGLPRPVRQYVVRDAFGVPAAKVDFAYPQWRIAVEADGYSAHSSRRDWTRDRVHANSLAVIGWALLRLTWEDVTVRRAATVSTILALIEQRSQELAK